MEAKEAARLAKAHIADLFADDKVQHVGLEEIEFDGLSGTWRVTVGFTRPWTDLNSPPFASVTEIMGVPLKRVRDMKVVTIDDSGKVVSVKNRE